jgi:hypothetical protein
LKRDVEGTMFKPVRVIGEEVSREEKGNYFELRFFLDWKFEIQLRFGNDIS